MAEIPKVIDGKRVFNINKEKMHLIRFNKSEISTSEDVETGRYTYKTSDLSAYTTEVIDVKQSSLNKTICNRGLCCGFELKIDYDESIVNKDSTYYRYIFFLIFKTVDL